MLRKELRPNMGQDLECIADIKNALDELGVKTVHELEVILRDLGADVIYMKSSDAEKRLTAALGTYATDMEEKRLVMIVADNLGRPSRPSNRLEQFHRGGRAFGESWLPAFAATGYDVDRSKADLHTVYVPHTLETMRETFPDGTRVFEVGGFMNQPDADVPDPRDDVNLPGCKWPDAVPAPHFPVGFDFSDIDTIVRGQDRMKALRAAYEAKFTDPEGNPMKPKRTLKESQKTYYQGHYKQYEYPKEAWLRDCLRSGYEDVGLKLAAYGDVLIPFPEPPTDEPMDESDESNEVESSQEV